MAPRVARCFDPKRAVIWFEVFDNPYAEPAELIAREIGKGADRVRTILYGIPVKSRSATFAKYNEMVHVIDDDQIPEVGFNYCIMDPAGTRNDALIWVRSTPTCDYVYREWPGSYHIPGVGVPGPWAKSSGRKKGWNDGDRDEGSDSFGFGFSRMKYEVARLEGWRDYEAWAKNQAPIDLEDGVALPMEDELEEWDEEHGAREGVVGRFMDSRPAASKRMENEGEVTLLDQWNKLDGWDWGTTPGNSVEGGTSMIVDALGCPAGARDGGEDEEDEKEIPTRLRIAKSCRNVRFALATYTGSDGGKGAVKDWIDLLRYFYRMGFALCGGADPLELARRFGPGAKRALVAKMVTVRSAGGVERQVAVAVRPEEARRRGTADGGRQVVRAGGRIVGGRGAKMVWRGGRRW